MTRERTRRETATAPIAGSLGLIAAMAPPHEASAMRPRDDGSRARSIAPRHRTWKAIERAGWPYSAVRACVSNVTSAARVALLDSPLPFVLCVASQKGGR